MDREHAVQLQAGLILDAIGNLHGTTLVVAAGYGVVLARAAPQRE
ncbi:MAG: hypothetical protein WAN17_08100 [Candidatus Sulfotelmatobacter sp.]